MGASSDTNSTSQTNQNTNSVSDSLTNFLTNLSKQYNTNTNQNTATSQTYSPSDAAKQLIGQAAQPVSGSQISQYQNPYQQQVVNSTLAQLNQQYGQQQSALTGNAISQNALGGDRLKVAQAALMGQQGMNTASTLAGLNSQGYQSALSAAQADQARQLQAAGLSGGTTTGGTQMQGQTAGTENATTSGQSTSHQSGNQQMQGTTNTQTETTQNPGLIGLGTTALGLFAADGGAIRRRADGGGNEEDYMTGLPGWAKPVPLQFPTATQGQNAKVAAPAQNDMQKLGKNARNILGNLFGANDTGDATPQSSMGKGSSDALASGGAVRRADGGADVLSALNDWNAANPETTGPLQDTYEPAQPMWGRGTMESPYIGAPGTGIGNLMGVKPKERLPEPQPGLAALSEAAAPMATPVAAFGPEAMGNNINHPASLAQLSPGNTQPKDQWQAKTEPQSLMQLAPEGQDVPIHMKTSVARDITTGKDLTPPTDEPGAEQLIPQTTSPNVTTQMGLESGTSDRIASLSNYSKDRSGSRSFGAYGINTLPGNSAWEFRDEQGKALGITANPNTAQFKQQWDAAAKRDPQALIAAEDAWHDKHVVQPTIKGLEKVGVPSGLANDPSVQGYFADRAVQYGPGMAFGKTHAERIRTAAEASNGDVGQFLNNMSQADKAGIHHDFHTYLSDHPNDVRGLQNRIDKRLAGSTVLGSEGGDAQVPGRNEEGKQVATRHQEAAAAPVGSLASLAPSASAAAPTQPAYPSAPNQDRGGILKRLFGIDFNPLKLSDTERMALIAGGLGGVNTGVNALNAGRGMDIQQQHQAQQMYMEAQKLQHDFAKPTVMGTSYDPTTGQPIHQYGSFNPTTNKYEPFAAAPGASATPTGQAIPNNLSGEDYRKALEEQAPAIHDRTLNILAGNEPMPKNSRGDPQAYAVNAAVRKIDPTFDNTRNDYLKKFNNPDNGSAKQLKAADTWYGHADELSQLADNLPNTGLNILNKGANWFKGHTNDANLNQYRSVASQVVDEKIKAITGGKPTVSEREQELARYDPSLGPETIKKTLAEDMRLIDSRSKSLASDYQKKMGPYAKPLSDVISPEHQEAYTRMQQQYGRSTAHNAVAPSASPAAATSRPTGMSDIQLREQAQQLIASGKDPAAVAKRLADWRVQPNG